MVKINSMIFCVVLSLNNIYSSFSLQKPKDFSLSIIHFNDFHARFEETSPKSTKCIPKNHACIGGFARLYSAIKQLIDEDCSSVLLGAGDDFQGTPWYNVFKWNVTQYFMNTLPLDARAIGNHEFDDGIEGVVPYLKAMKAPTIVANMDVTEEPSLIELYKESHIIERKGVKIGLTGVIIKTTNKMAITGKVKFTDEIEAVQRVANDLTSQGVDIIIVISHCGIDIDKQIAGNVSNIDIIVGGHSHSLLYPAGQKPPNGEQPVEDYPVAVKHARGKTVLIVQASSFTKYLGNIKVNFNSKGDVKSWTGKPIYLDSSIPQDEKILKLMKPFKERLDMFGQRIIGYTSVDLDNSQCKRRECNIGNFIADAFVDFCVGLAPKDSWTLAAACIINNGGIRTSIERGNITYSDLMTTLPFNNQVQTFEIKGKYLLEALEYSVKDSKSEFQVSGLRITYNMTQCLGNRVVSAKIRCSACDIPIYSDIEAETMYSIVTTDYVADGVGGYTMISKNKINAVNHGLDIDILENYITKHTVVHAKMERRIKIVS